MAEQMKPSGIDWIGDIPESWKVTRLQTLFDQVKDKNSGTKEKNLLSLSYGKIVKKDIEGAFGLIPESFDTYNIIKKNDIVLRLTDMQNDQVSLRTGLVKEEKGIITSAYVTIRLKCGSPSYYHWYLYAFDTSKQIYAFGQGVRQSLTFEELKKMLILLPSPKEQQAIADFLDEECAQIDSIAADLEKQIALLQQYKKSLITETVTKGLDKSVPMKDSGVEWIGEIPVGWELSRIKYLTDNHHPYPIGDGDHGMIKADDYLTEGIPYIRVLNLTWGSGLNLENLVFISKEMNSLIKNSELKPNDILIAKTGATIGKTAIVPDSLPVSNTTSHVGKITLANVHDAKYFYYVMTSSIVQKQIQDISAMQSTRPELGIEGLKNLILTVPPFDIQQHIARFLDDHCAKIDRVLHEKGKQLSVIKQHKKSLIYEYVTGKKRVKEVR